jgi:hypothetical protein
MKKPRLTPDDLRNMNEPTDHQYRMIALVVGIIIVLGAVFNGTTPLWVWICGIIVAIVIAIVAAFIYCSQLLKNQKHHK